MQRGAESVGRAAGSGRVALAVVDRLARRSDLDKRKLFSTLRGSRIKYGNQQIGTATHWALRNLDLRFLDAGSGRANRLIVARYGDDESLEKAYDYGE